MLQPLICVCVVCTIFFWLTGDLKIVATIFFSKMNLVKTENSGDSV